MGANCERPTGALRAPRTIDLREPTPKRHHAPANRQRGFRFASGHGCDN